jgi:hypothetical protein
VAGIELMNRLIALEEQVRALQTSLAVLERASEPRTPQPKKTLTLPNKGKSTASV